MKYNRKGNLIEEKEYDLNGVLKEKTIYKYDKKENLIETITDSN